MSKGLCTTKRALRHATSFRHSYPALNAHHALASNNKHPHLHPHPPPHPPLLPPHAHTRNLTTSLPLSSHENPLNLPRRSSPPPPKNAPELARRAQRGLPEKRRIPSVRHTIAITSAKGGVGKSTLAANLALAFARQGHRAGILDTDIFGPSVPTLLGLGGQEARVDGASGRLIPPTSYGVRSMSMGYLMREDQPVAWRGLMVMKALQQLLHEVAWGGLDVLVLDMPPGTGDTQLTISQQVEMDGGVVVSTPQDVALKDAVRGKEMMGRVGTRVLGVVRNMSVFRCPGCGREERVFGGNNGAKEEEMGMGGMEVLADLPLDRRICEDADRGMPTVVAEPESGRAKAYLELAERVGKMIGMKPLDDS